VDGIIDMSFFFFFQVPHLRPKAYSRVERKNKSVTRAYGGSRCAHCVRER